MLENINTVSENSTPTSQSKQLGFWGHFPQKNVWASYIHGNSRKVAIDMLRSGYGTDRITTSTKY